MNDIDVRVDLPKEHKKFKCSPDSSQMFDMFRCQFQLAKLESRIYTELFFARAYNRSALEQLRSVGELDKERLAIGCTNRDPTRRAYPMLPATVPNCVLDSIRVFQLRQYDTSCVHTTGVPGPTATLARHHRLRVLTILNLINPRVYLRQSTCLATTRSTSNSYNTLMSSIHFDSTNIFGVYSTMFFCCVYRFDYTLLTLTIRTQMYYPLSAFLLLFANMVHNSEDPSVAADLQLMDLVISALISPDSQTG